MSHPTLHHHQEPSQEIPSHAADNEQETVMPQVTTENLSPSHERHMEDDISKPFRFERLPIEIQLQVVQAIGSEKHLLQFRLVSSLTNALVLEPMFWQTIQFSKQRYFKTGSSASSSSSSTSPSPSPTSTGTLASKPRRTSVHQPSLFHSALEGYPQMHQHQHQYQHPPPPRQLQPAFIHSSDANLIVHRQSFAASLLGGSGYNVFSSGLGGSEPQAMSTTSTTSFPRSSDSRLSKSLPSGVSIMSEPGKTSAWAKKEMSFLSFLSRLTQNNVHTAQGVQQATIDDWEGERSVGDLWDKLLEMEQLQTLSIRHSVLKQLAPSAALTLGSVALHGHDYSPSWQHLTLLDLRDCLHLKDLSGIHELMPNLLEVNLEGCLGLNDFGPLSKEGGSWTKAQKHAQQAPELKLRKINLSRTKVRDQDLVRILQRSPHLQELRLDQCYDLTAASLVVIGQGDEHGQGHAHGHGHGHGHGHAHGEQGQGHLLSTSQPPTLWSSSTSCVPELKILSVKYCCDLTDEGIRALVGCRRLELLIIRGLQRVDNDTIEWLHAQGVPLRRVLNPLGKWRSWHV